MAEFEIGDLVEWFDPAGPSQFALVVAKQSSAQGTIRTFAPNPSDDIPIGPTGAWTSDPTQVSINDTQNPGTATLSAGSRLPQDLRDNSDAWSVTPFGFDDTFWKVVEIGGIPQPHREHIVCSQQSRETWITHTTKTLYTEVSFEVRNRLGSTVTVELYVKSGLVVTGPNSDYADVIDPGLTITSLPVTQWQPFTIPIGGATYPGNLFGRTYTLRVISGPQVAGTDPWQFRDPCGFAGPIVI